MSRGFGKKRQIQRIKRIGNGPATKYTTKVESVEFLTQLQIAMEELKKNLT